MWWRATSGDAGGGIAGTLSNDEVAGERPSRGPTRHHRGRYCVAWSRSAAGAGAKRVRTSVEESTPPPEPEAGAEPEAGDEHEDGVDDGEGDEPEPARSFSLRNLTPLLLIRAAHPRQALVTALAMGVAAALAGPADPRAAPGRGHRAGRPVLPGLVQRPRRPRSRRPAPGDRQAGGRRPARSRHGLVRPRDRGLPRRAPRHRERRLCRLGVPDLPRRRGARLLDLDPQAVPLVAAVGGVVRPAAGVPVLRRMGRPGQRLTPGDLDDRARRGPRDRRALPSGAVGPGAGPGGRLDATSRCGSAASSVPRGCSGCRRSTPSAWSRVWRSRRPRSDSRSSRPGRTTSLSAMHLRRPLALTAGALVLALGGLTSCGFDLATDRPYQPGEGTNDQSGDVEVLSALIVAAQPNEGTVIVTLVNSTDDEQSLTGVASGDLEVTDFDPIVGAAARARQPRGRRWRRPGVRRLRRRPAAPGDLHVRERRHRDASTSRSSPRAAPTSASTSPRTPRTSRTTATPSLSRWAGSDPHPGPPPARGERVERQEPLHGLGRRPALGRAAAPRPCAAASCSPRPVCCPTSCTPRCCAGRSPPPPSPWTPATGTGSPCAATGA